MAQQTVEALQALVEEVQARVEAQGMLLSLVLRHGNKPAAELFELVRAAAGKFVDHQAGTDIAPTALDAGKAVFAVAQESLAARKAEGE